MTFHYLEWVCRQINWEAVILLFSREFWRWKTRSETDWLDWLIKKNIRSRDKSLVIAGGIRTIWERGDKSSKTEFKGGLGGGAAKGGPSNHAFCWFRSFFSFSNLLKTQLKNKEAILFHNKRWKCSLCRKTAEAKYYFDPFAGRLYVVHDLNYLGKILKFWWEEKSNLE